MNLLDQPDLPVLRDKAQLGLYGPPYKPSFKRASVYPGKSAGLPMLTPTDGQYATIYWPWVVKASDILGGSALDKYYLYYSTDHASGGGTTGGIALFTGPNPLGPWTNRGQVFIDSSGGSQTETPSVLWVPEDNKFYMYYQQSASLGAVGNQSTCLATSPDGVTWTRFGRVLDIPNLVQQPGDGHTGYFLPFRLNGGFAGYHLRGGASYPHGAISYSNDGKTWFTDPRMISNQQDMANDSNYRLSNPVLFNWRGRVWGAYIKSTFSSFGSATGTNDLVGAPMAPNLKRPLTPPTSLMTYDATWETTQHLRAITCYTDPNGKIYLYYQIDQNIGVLIGGDS